MINVNRIKSSASRQAQPPFYAFALDLLLYLAVMFLIREVYYTPAGFIANGLFWSLTTLLVASWRMHVRRVTWADLGLTRPDSLRRTTIATAVILGLALLSIIVFQILKDQL